MISPIDFNARVIGRTIVEVQQRRGGGGAIIQFELDDGNVIGMYHQHESGGMMLNTDRVDGRRTEGER